MEKKIKVLNLYAGIGGNRKLWPNDEIEVTAVENVPEIAKIYQDFFPNDKVIVADAHEYLLRHYKEFDFIWSSPPCPSHSRTQKFLIAQKKNEKKCTRYPDMKLYQEIIFLQHFFKGKFVVENVISYYEPLIKPKECERHYFWTNFPINKKDYLPSFNLTNCRGSSRLPQKIWIKKLKDLHGFDIDLSKLKINHSEKVLTNCVNPKLGLYIFNLAFKEPQTTLGDL